MKEVFTEKIREILRDEKSMSDFANKCGVSEATIRGYVKGISEPSYSKLIRISEVANVSLDWLAGISTDKKPEKTACGRDREKKESDRDCFEQLPLVSASFNAGDVAGYYAFRKSWLMSLATSISNLALVSICGYSMSPTLIDRDIVMVDTGQKDLIDDCLYAIRMDKTVVVKRIRQRPSNIIQIVSDNHSEYPPYTANKDELEVFGKIVWSSRAYS